MRRAGISKLFRKAPPSRLFRTAWYRDTYLDATVSDRAAFAHYRAHSKSGLFDPNPLFDTAYYIAAHPECLAFDGTVLDFHEAFGIQGEHKPNFWFDVGFYRNRYADLPEGDFDALGHYLEHGAAERRSTHPLFDHAWYARVHLDRPGLDGLGHFLRHGEAEGRDPHPLLDVGALARAFGTEAGFGIARSYVENQDCYAINPCDVFEAGFYREKSGLDRHVNPLLDYLAGGWRRAEPNPYFDAPFYLARYADLRDGNINPLVHYVTAGHAEQRHPSGRFATTWYREHYPDVDASGLNPLAHFLRVGRAEGRHAVPPTDAPAETDPRLNLDPTQHPRLREQAFLRSGRTLAFRTDKAPRVSILLVLYNKSHLTLDCLESLMASTDYDACPYEVVVYDNGSTDGTSLIRARVSGIKWITAACNAGFIVGVNAAFDQADGEFVLLLNNDTQVLSGSIARACAVMDADATVGAVGAKLVLPNGRLQEAGSIVWADGSCLGYARGHSPDAYEANFQRDVDYASGAFLLIRSRLFAELGKLDAIYHPAYYEETDLCAKLRRSGSRVIYDPEVEVFHLEFGSAASYQDAIGQQVKNRAIFLERNPEVALGHAPSGDNILRARFARNDRLNLLIVDDAVPAAAAGTPPRARRLIDAIARSGFNATLLPTGDEFRDWRSVRKTVHDRVEVAFGYDDGRLGLHLAERAGYYDAVLVRGLGNMALLARVLEESPSDRHQFVLIHDGDAPIPPDRGLARRADLIVAASGPVPGQAVIAIDDGAAMSAFDRGVADLHRFVRERVGRKTRTPDEGVALRGSGAIEECVG